MTPDDEKELLESIKRIADSFQYLNNAVKAIAAKNWNVSLPDPNPSQRRS